ncbi:MAG: hypothetical protein RR416_03125 [Clostridia bacterium]
MKSFSHTCKKTIILIALCALLILSSFSFFYARTGATVSAEASTLDSWNEFQITVNNNINDYKFELKAFFKFNRTTGEFDIRIYKTDITAKAHYFEQSGYTWDASSFTGWKESADNLYYQTTAFDYNKATLTINYQSSQFSVIFMDSFENKIISTMTVSKGGTVAPPEAPKHIEKGYIFQKWEGGVFENVQRNTTIYAIYAPVRYLTIIYPDGVKEKKAVAYGTKYGDIKMEFGGKIFKCFSSTEKQSDQIKNDSVVTDDMEVYAFFQNMETWKGWAIAAGVTVGVAIIIGLAVALKK